jgi:hypothetical protein
MIFLQGTLLMHKSGKNVDRVERVWQVINKEQSVSDYQNYVPVGNASSKIMKWKDQGAEIFYLSGQQSQLEADDDKEILIRNNFPDCELLWREGTETFAEIAERIMPDILIEDDCESIGGAPQMTITNISSEKRSQIKSIVLPEFGGIDYLPDSIEQLVDFQKYC